MSESGLGAGVLQRNLRPGVYWGESEDTHPDLLLDSLPTRRSSPSGKSLTGRRYVRSLRAFPSYRANGSTPSVAEGDRVLHRFWMTRPHLRAGLSRATTGESPPSTPLGSPTTITDGAAQKRPNWRSRWSRSMAPIPLRLRRSAPPGRAGGAPAPCAADKEDEVPVETARYR